MNPQPMITIPQGVLGAYRLALGWAWLTHAGVALALLLHFVAAATSRQGERPTPPQRIRKDGCR